MTVSNSNCPDTPVGKVETFPMTINDPGNGTSLTINSLYTCNISGNTISYSGSLAPEPECTALGGSMTGTINFTVNSATNMSGSFLAICDPFCGTLYNITATKAGGGGGDGGGCVMNPQAKMDLSLVILFMLSIYRISRIYWRKAIHRA
jgi:hypothetical protein